MIGGASWLRLGVLLAAGALAVHELRYLLAHQGHVEQALARHGHGYLMAVTPVVGVLLALVLGHVLHRLAYGPRSAIGAGRSPLRWRRAAALLIAGLLILYSGQELLEAVLAGHPPGFGEVFGHGGWVAAPLSVLTGGVLAVLVRETNRALACPPRLVALRFEGRAFVRMLQGVWAGAAISPPLARRLGGRAPPLPFA